MHLDGMQIKNTRKQKKISQQNFAKQLGVSVELLSKIESNTIDFYSLDNHIQEKFIAELGQLTLFPSIEDEKNNTAKEWIEDDTKNVITDELINKGFLASKNSLNDLSGKEWIVETKSIWRQKGLGANHPETKYEKLHPAPFSFQDVARLIRFFTKKNMLVLDPMCGSASTLKAAALEGRKGLGIELSSKWAELGRVRLEEETPDASQQEIWCMDIREAIEKIPDESVHLIITSPPYWGILNKPADHKVKNVRIANGLDTNYSGDKNDLANISDYETFLVELSNIFRELARKMIPGKYCAIIVSDFKHGKKFYPFHSDLYNHIECDLLQLQGITILEQAHKALYPYGYPYAYVPNIHHQYILLFRRPLEKQKTKLQRQA